MTDTHTHSENMPISVEITETMKQTGYVDKDGKFVATEAPVYLQTGEDAQKD